MSAQAAERLFWTPHAWLAGAWREHVLLRADARGHWAEIAPGVATPPAGAIVLAGPVLPGLVDAHSHAFQRAMAGLAERRDAGEDDFWSWRDRMYGVALRITPEQLRAVAAQLYIELLPGGYTQVCEFHYLQHRPDGSPYDDPMQLSWALADAAADAGLGLTLLPVLYERAGFDADALRDDQRRFATMPAAVADLCGAARRSGRPHVNSGIAIHSLRAASPGSMRELHALAEWIGGPIHIHVAEQTGEVRDCLKATGARPARRAGPGRPHRGRGSRRAHPARGPTRRARPAPRCLRIPHRRVAPRSPAARPAARRRFAGAARGAGRTRASATPRSSCA